jgi:lauroyl/myristoyl acyltransferase
MSQNNKPETREISHQPKKRLLAWASAVPYGLGSRILSSLLGNPLTQRLLLRGPRRQFMSLCRAVGATASPTQQFALHLQSRFTVPWRVSVLSHLDDADFDRWVHVENADLLTRLQNAGRPVLLVNSHTAIARLTPLAILRLGHELTVIEPEPYLKIIGARGAERIRSITLRGQGEKFWMKELYQAQKVLAGKGIVHLALDGHQGSGGVERNFLGQQRLFHVSLAQLAMQMGADIVLVRALLNPNGAISLQLTGPLDTGLDTDSGETRLKLFLDQYVGYLENLWRSQTGNISPRHLRHFMQQKAV